MKYIDSGNNRIPLITLLAILSISLTVNLPGLAISPILGKLNQVFSNVTDLEIQLLTVLPNLVTIPFILCSGKICTPRNQITVLTAGLGIYTATGILYFFASSMIELIILSCLLGVGCGLIIPLAASLIAQNFSGNSRTRQLGMKSSLSNFMVIIATLFVGWVAAINWHLAFLVYLVPLIPLCLIPFMRSSFISKHTIPLNQSDRVSTVAPKAETVVGKPVRKTGKKLILALAGVMAVYLIATYATQVVSYYLPFTMEHYHLDTSDVGVATAMFYAAASLAGSLLTPYTRMFRAITMQSAIFLCLLGLFIAGIMHVYFAYIIGIFIMGFGYGIIQPAIYDKTSRLAPTPQKNTAYFSYLLTCNYIGISIVPFVVQLAEKVCHQTASVNFSFLFNALIMAAMLLLAITGRKAFVFHNQPSD